MRREIKIAGETYFIFSWLNDEEAKSLYSYKRSSSTNTEQLEKQNKDLQAQLIKARNELVQMRENAREMNQNELDRL